MKANETIIFSDMDGTLLTDWSKGPYIPEANLEAIRRFIEAGGLFSVATGRQYGNTLRFFGNVRFSAPSVQGNGAVIYDSRVDKILKTVLLPEAVKLECLDYYMSHDGVWLVTADEHEIFQVLSGEKARDESLTDLKRKPMTIAEYRAFKPVKSCFIIQDAGLMDGLVGDMGHFKSAELFKPAQSSPFILELLEKSVDKASAIAEVIQIIGAQDKTLVCIGDYDNDRDMLLQADFAACPENASEAVLQIAKLKTCSNNEGAVADLIRQLFNL